MSKNTDNKGKNKTPLVKHGINTWLRAGKVNPSIRGHRKLEAYLRGIELDLIEQQGGQDKLTAGKEILIKSTVEAYGVVILASMYCKKQGILRPDMARRGVIELQPVMGKQVIAFWNLIRQNLSLLGLDRKRAEAILTPFEIAEKIDREKDEGHSPHEGGQGEASRQGKGTGDGDERE